MNGTYKQDLPPEGGYPGIKFTRNIPKQRFSGLTVIVGGISFMVFGWVVGISQNKERSRIIKEGLCARLYLLPLLQAEEDRKILRSMIAFEEEEGLIMKDVPGWQVGKSVYHSDKWIPPISVLLKDHGKDFYK